MIYLIFYIFFFPTVLFADNSIVLECFALDDTKYEFRYYGIKNDNIYYFNENNRITKIPYDNLAVKGKKMFALTPQNALKFTLEGNAVTLKRKSKNGEEVNYACSRLKNRDLKEFEKYQ